MKIGSPSFAAPTQHKKEVKLERKSSLSSIDTADTSNDSSFEESSKMSIFSGVPAKIKAKLQEARQTVVNKVTQFVHPDKSVKKSDFLKKLTTETAHQFAVNMLKKNKIEKDSKNILRKEEGNLFDDLQAKLENLTTAKKSASQTLVTDVEKYRTDLTSKYNGSVYKAVEANKKSTIQYSEDIAKERDQLSTQLYCYKDAMLKAQTDAEHSVIVINKSKNAVEENKNHIAKLESELEKTTAKQQKHWLLTSIVTFLGINSFFGISLKSYNVNNIAKKKLELTNLATKNQTEIEALSLHEKKLEQISQAQTSLAIKIAEMEKNIQKQNEAIEQANTLTAYLDNVISHVAKIQKERNYFIPMADNDFAFPAIPEFSPELKNILDVIRNTTAVSQEQYLSYEWSELDNFIDEKETPLLNKVEQYKNIKAEIMVTQDAMNVAKENENSRLSAIAQDSLKVSEKIVKYDSASTAELFTKMKKDTTRYNKFTEIKRAYTQYMEEKFKKEWASMTAVARAEDFYNHLPQELQAMAKKALASEISDSNSKIKS